jgi:hypothetical protein
VIPVANASSVCHDCVLSDGDHPPYAVGGFLGNGTLRRKSPSAEPAFIRRAQVMLVPGLGRFRRTVQGSHSVMPISLEDALLNVWQQSLVEGKKIVTLEEQRFPVRSTAKRKLKQIDFQFDGKDMRGLEQNPDTKSRWAAMARSGKKVMQFLEGGRYIAVVADGKVHLYAPKK